MEGIKVSVIVALYNTINYLDCFFDCLLKQTFKEFEIIIVDDLSNDGSYEKALRFKNDNPNVIIKLIRASATVIKRRKIKFLFITLKPRVYPFPFSLMVTQ